MIIAAVIKQGGFLNCDEELLVTFVVPNSFVPCAVHYFANAHVDSAFLATAKPPTREDLPSVETHLAASLNPQQKLEPTTRLGLLRNLQGAVGQAWMQLPASQEQQRNREAWSCHRLLRSRSARNDGGEWPCLASRSTPPDLQLSAVADTARAAVAAAVHGFSENSCQDQDALSVWATRNDGNWEVNSCVLNQQPGWHTHCLPSRKPFLSSRTHL